MKKNVLARTIALVLVALMVLGIIAMGASAAEEDGVVIKLHYNRPDGVYDDWSVWFWNLGKDGADIPFAEENGEMVATFPVEPGATSVGFIVKLPGWAAKDVNEDQFIDVAAFISGTVHVYVESGVPGYTVVNGDDAVIGIKLTGVSYDEKTTNVQVKMTASIGDGTDAFVLTGPEGVITPVSVTEDASHVYTLELEQPLDLYSSYTLTYDGQDYGVKLPNIYSTEEFEADYTYEGDDLGATWTAEKTTFRVWAPTADAVRVNLYESGTEGTEDLIEQLTMTPDVNGTWVAEKEGDLNGTYYTYEVDVIGETREACDPYARATGVNGKRAMVIDLDSTDPEGWENDVDPHYDNEITDAVIYELHIRDLSVDESSGIQNKGKYLGVIETGTTNAAGVPTGLDHIKSLGVTHLHLLPSYDYGSVDESKLDIPQFNWGYDPVNYNVPEGSYSTDPYNGAVRVAEFKQMVQGLHENGISVVMDVVYNHVYSADSFCFNQIVPRYFSRVNENGSYSSGSGCGNDTASERSMVSKYIVDSVKYWADEYHIDGFRFDLVGLIDTETMNTVIEEVHKTHPNVIFYGEGWTMSTTMTKEGYELTTQTNSTLVPEFAFFSDTLRDALKGNVFNNTEKGYVSGVAAYSSTINQCFVGAPNWCKSPTQTINYSSCHDNNTLYDRITISTPNASVEDRIRMNNLAAAITMTSQGIPFIHAGEEMLRSKPLPDGGYDHNSYNNTDAVNSLKWDDLNQAEYQSVFSYYQGLIAFRAAHPALRMTSAEEISQQITKLEGLEFGITGFHIAPGSNGEENEFVVIFNPKTSAITVDLPRGEWEIYISGQTAGTEVLGTAKGGVEVEPISAMVLVRQPSALESIPMGVLIAVAAVAGVAIVSAVVVIVIKKRKK